MICSLILGALIGWIASKLMGSRGGLIRNLIAVTTSYYVMEKLQERLAKMAGGVAVI